MLHPPLEILLKLEIRHLKRFKIFVEVKTREKKFFLREKLLL
jgi:hypothetical protein